MIEEKRQKEEITKPLKIAVWCIIIGVPVIALTPWLFTLPLGWVNFTKTGDIGDTIGGTTAPFIGLLSAILIFLALKAQIKANLIIQDQITDQKKEKQLEDESKKINLLYTHLKENIDNFRYSTLDTWKFGKKNSCTGSEAIYKLFHDFYCNETCNDEEELLTNPKLTELISILEICDTLLDRIMKSEIPDKDTIWQLTTHQFDYKIYPRIKGTSEDIDNLTSHYCEPCKKRHGLPLRVLTLLKKIREKIHNDAALPTKPKAEVA